MIPVRGWRNGTRNSLLPARSYLRFRPGLSKRLKELSSARDDAMRDITATKVKIRVPESRG